MGLVVVKAGWLTTVQDLGRWGGQHLGIPVAGAMDVTSHRLANALVGNAVSAATLEVTIGGPMLRFDQPTAFAVTGADFELTLDGTPVSMNCVYECRSRQSLGFGRRRRGARAYVAVAGGVDVPPVFGSRSTHVTSSMGGMEGRALRAGDRLPVGIPTGERVSVCLPSELPPLPVAGAKLRVLEGARIELDPQALETFYATRYRVTAESDRMGYRLEGPPVEAAPGGDRISAPSPIGAVQLPPGGRPIVLTADRQTIGGYLPVAIVISADLPVLGQLMASDWVEFVPCTPDEALTALRARERLLPRAEARAKAGDDDESG